ncbi:TatD family hydrolase [Ferruginibacter sp.]|uniref:TatD family hydrolase n=1 Tax=Ferruginibacter sp. TaxID=1940288 RepID=UPI00265ABCF6|nr:TatD family hydrolase [Ferruginibacter sp.]
MNHDAAAVVQRAIGANVQPMILTGTSTANSRQGAALAQQYPGVLFATAGIHPHDARHFNEESINELRLLLLQPTVVSVGECGLDFDRDFSPRSLQEECYEAQLQLAVEIKKPLFLHERAAFARFNSITDNFSTGLPNAVVHCFTGTLQEAKTYLDKGYYLGFTGAVSDVKRFAHLKEVIAYMPMERMMIETDAPYMMPKNVDRQVLLPHHERRNEPAFLPYVAATIAHIKNIALADVAIQTTLNAKKFFAL